MRAFQPPALHRRVTLNAVFCQEKRPPDAAAMARSRKNALGFPSMTSTLQLEILDLRHYSATQLRPVLAEESLVWNRRLKWDYRPSADLLLHYLDSRILPGYVAIERGMVSGYIFCVYEESKAIIGDVFGSPTRSEDPPSAGYLPGSSAPARPSPAELAAVDVENRLLKFMAELLQNSPGVDRVESQLLLHPH